MSWRFPTYRPTDGDIINVEHVQAIRPYQEELGGQLDGTNFKASAWSSGSHVAVDTQLAFKISKAAVEMTFDGGTGKPDGFSNRRISAARQWVAIPRSASSVWEQSLTLVARAMVHITASFQVIMTDESASPEVMDGSPQNGPPVRWAIVVDGVPQLAGANGGELGNFDCGWVHSLHAPIVEAVVELDPGAHVIQVAGFISEVSTLTVFPDVVNQELIIKAFHA